MIDLGAQADQDNLTVGAATERAWVDAGPAGLQPALRRQVTHIKRQTGIDGFTPELLPAS